jgi:hypothetical protein
MIRRLGYYIRKAVKFHEIKGDWVAPVIFVLMLLIGFSGSVIPSEVLSSFYPNMLYNLVSMTLINFITAVYVFAFINDLSGRVYNSGSISTLLRRMGWRIALTAFVTALLTLPVTLVASYTLSDSALYNLPDLETLLERLALATVFMIVYAAIIIILYLRYFLVFCYLVDKQTGLLASLKASAKRTRGNRAEIFAILIIVNVILFFASAFLMTFADLFRNVLIFSFITVFGSTIFGLVQQRLITLIYTDLEYGNINSGKEF